MRFICLHGIGSNSRILQQQTAALRYELGETHSYDFVEGTLPQDVDPAFEDMVLGDEETFAYSEPSRADSCLKACEYLEKYLEDEGPYDGVIGFSMGANIALAWLVHKTQQAKQTPAVKLPFKVAIMFSNPSPLYNIDALRKGRIIYLDPVAPLVDVPTTHIWGTADPENHHAERNTAFCSEESRFVYTHSSGHCIPTSPQETTAMVKLVNRAISEAEKRS